MQCETMESTSDYLKNNLPLVVEDKITTIVTNALQMDLRSKLQTFETEYQVMDELSSAFRLDIKVETLESVNEVLKKQNKELIEQLAICRGSIRNLETTVLAMQQELEAQRERIERSDSAENNDHSYGPVHPILQISFKQLMLARIHGDLWCMIVPLE